MKNKDLLDRLPSSWEDFKFEDYLKTLDIPITEEGDVFVGLDNTLKVVSAITDIPVEELELLDLATIQEIGKKLSFMVQLPEFEKKKASSIQWKDLDKITYNDFVTFISLSNDLLHQLPTIIKTFSVKELTLEQINEFSTAEVYSAFFSLKRTALKSLKHSTRVTAMRLAKQNLKLIPGLIKQKLGIKGKS